MKVTFEELQEAFINECITLEQFYEVLADNWGHKYASEVMIKNLQLAMESNKN